MFYNYPTANVINMWKINKAKKNLTFNMKFTKKNLQILNLLKSSSLINNFIIFQNNSLLFVKIYLYYFKSLPIGSNFKLMSTPSKSFFISFKALKLIAKRTGGSTFIISNSYGLMKHSDAIKKKTGGMFIGFFSL